jgi:hypothetical protein
MTDAQWTTVAMALIKLITTETNRQQLTAFLGLNVEPALPSRMVRLLEALDRRELRGGRDQVTPPGMFGGSRAIGLGLGYVMLSCLRR